MFNLLFSLFNVCLNKSIMKICFITATVEMFRIQQQIVDET